MAFFFNTPEDQQEMLSAIGLSDVAELFESIPESVQLGRDLQLPAAMGELELTQHMQRLAERNASSSNSTCFLGAGSYDQRRGDSRNHGSVARKVVDHAGNIKRGKSSGRLGSGAASVNCLLPHGGSTGGPWGAWPAAAG